MIEAWRQDYNVQRPHSALGSVPPTEFARDREMALRSPTVPSAFLFNGLRCDWRYPRRERRVAHTCEYGCTSIL